MGALFGESLMAQLPIWSKTKTGIAFSDIPTVPGGRMPDFCIVGAAKGGTSSLNAYLDSHRSVFMCPLKEPNYFSTPVIFERGEQWYRGLYADATEGQLCGEASTSYTRYPAVPGTAKKMAKANPAMKIIYCIREPVSRTESDCLQVLKYVRGVLGKDYTSMPLDDFYQLLSDPSHEFYCAPRETSMYVDQLKHFEKYFQKDQIKIVESEQLSTDTKTVVNEIFAFLGLPTSEEIDFKTRQNVTANFTDALREEQGLLKYRGSTVYVLANTLLPERLKAYLRKRIARDISLGHLHFSDTLRKQLATGFSEPNARLQQRYGLQLKHW